MVYIFFFTAGDLLFLLGVAAVAVLMAGSGIADIFTWITDNATTLFIASIIIGLICAIICYILKKDICLSWAVFADTPLVPTTIVLMIAEIVKDFREDITYGFLALLPNILIALVLFAIFLFLMLFGLWGISGLFGDIDDESSKIWRFFRALIVCVIQNVILYNLFLSE